MAKLEITIACGDYDRTQALKDGTVKVEGAEINYIPSVPGETFWRMLNSMEFDAALANSLRYPSLYLPSFMSRFRWQSARRGRWHWAVVARAARPTPAQNPAPRCRGWTEKLRLRLRTSAAATPRVPCR